MERNEKGEGEEVEGGHGKRVEKLSMDRKLTDGGEEEEIEMEEFEMCG